MNLREFIYKEIKTTINGMISEVNEDIVDQAFHKAKPVDEKSEEEKADYVNGYEPIEEKDSKRDYKKEYEKYGKSEKAKKYRAELNKYNRQKGTYGNGDGKDASHKGGKIVGFEDESKNRGRREKSRLKKEGMVEPRRGHNYYQLIKDAPVKYIESQSNPTGATGVLLHNKDGYLKGKKGAYVIDYFGAHFYVDLKSKFATQIYGLKDQRELRKAIQSVGMAPEHSDWKKYVKEIPFRNESTLNEVDMDSVLKIVYFLVIWHVTSGALVGIGKHVAKFFYGRSKVKAIIKRIGKNKELVAAAKSKDEEKFFKLLSSTLSDKDFDVLMDTGASYTRLKRKVARESVNEEQLDEKLITFSNRAPYGQIVFMAGGAGSGKGFAIDNFIDAAGFKVRDVDEMKKAVGKLDQLGKFSVDKWYKKYGKKLSDKPVKGGGLSPKAHIEEFVLGKGLSISDISKDLKNPNNVASLHYIVDSMGLKDKWLISMLSGKNNKETLPNLLFDITAKKVSSITDVIKPLIANGYDSKNIHLIWVLTNFHVAIQANKERDRMVPEDILLQTHEGAGKSMWSVMTKILPKGLNGRIDVILNNRNETVPYTDKDGKPIKVEPSQQNKLEKAQIVVKDFKSLPIKKQGGGVLPEKTWKMLLKSWILDNAPKTIDLSQDLETSEEYMI